MSDASGRHDVVFFLSLNHAGEHFGNALFCFACRNKTRSPEPFAKHKGRLRQIATNRQNLRGALGGNSPTEADHPRRRILASFLSNATHVDFFDSAVVPHDLQHEQLLREALSALHAQGHRACGR